MSYYYYYYYYYRASTKIADDSRTEALSNAIALLISARRRTRARPSAVGPGSLFYLPPSRGWWPWRCRIRADHKRLARYGPVIQKHVVLVVVVVVDVVVVVVMVSGRVLWLLFLISGLRWVLVTTVWSIPERFRGELLTMGRYTNLFSFTFTFYLVDIERTSIAADKVSNYYYYYYYYYYARTLQGHFT